MKVYTNGVDTKEICEKAYNVIYKAQGYVLVEEGVNDGAGTKRGNKGKNK